METETRKLKLLRRHIKWFSTSALTLAIVLEQSVPTFAAITNSATASGTYNAGTTTSTPSAASVNVTPAAPGLSIVKTIAAVPVVNPTINLGADNLIADALDTVTYTYTVQNTGTITLLNVKPVDVQPQFNGVNGTNVFPAFTPFASLAPGNSTTFTATYIMSAIDVDRAAGITNGLTNIASTTADTPTGGTYNGPNSAVANATIPAGPKLQVVKSVFTAPPGGTADVGEHIIYRYRVTNIGNVAMTDVVINDTHEGTLLPALTVTGETFVSNGPLGAVPATTDNNPTAGIWGTLQPGAVIDFFYDHTVGQTEYDNG
jgi:uncharacterized repeat protein (TIGR01451 family)